MCKFSKGNVVKLHSDNDGNCPMTVDGYWKDESKSIEAIRFEIANEQDMKMVKCVWRDNNNEPHREYYHEDSLLLIE